MGKRMNWSRATKLRPDPTTASQRRLEQAAERLIAQTPAATRQRYSKAAHGPYKPVQGHPVPATHGQAQRARERGKHEMVVTDGMNPDGTLRVFTGEAARRQFNAPWD